MSWLLIVSRDNPASSEFGVLEELTVDCNVYLPLLPILVNKQNFRCSDFPVLVHRFSLVVSVVNLKAMVSEHLC